MFRQVSNVALAALCLIFIGPASAKSPTTVRESLAWLARHQLQDGSWRFDPPVGAERGYADPGTWKSDAGATALALLPYLGARQTHKAKGPYQQNVKNGIHWLIVHQKPSGEVSRDGTRKMLSHDLATIALSDAYGMTGDDAVGAAAQKAVRFIVEQDAKADDGSDVPGKPPTLSVAAWKIMAIRNAKMASLEVPPAVLEKAGKFLAGFQSAEGMYGETGPRDASNAATAMGLLSRLYLDGNPSTLTVFGGHLTIFSPDDSTKPAAWVQGGQQFLSHAGPSAKDCTYNLYATVFMHILSGNDWDTWNRKMRKQLVDSQIKGGDEAGSWWNPGDVRAAEGGRLFQTAVNTLMLEVSY